MTTEYHVIGFAFLTVVLLTYYLFRRDRRSHRIFILFYGGTLMTIFVYLYYLFGNIPIADRPQMVRTSIITNDILLSLFILYHILFDRQSR